MKRIFALLMTVGILAGGFWGGIAGCEVQATDEPGVFVPNVKGTYALENVTASCADQFDAVVEVVQDEANLIIQASSSSFTDLTGTIDENGAITATGASRFGSPFECTGQFAASIFSGVCVSSIETCALDATGVNVCTTTDLSCGFTYRKS